MTTFEKNLRKKDYHVWTFMGFKLSDQVDGHIHDIVFDNTAIFVTYVYLGRKNSCAKANFEIIFKKYNFPFPNFKMVLFFCAASAKNLMQNVINPIFSQIRPYFIDYPQILWFSLLSSYFHPFKWRYEYFLKVIQILTMGVR